MKMKIMLWVFVMLFVVNLVTALEKGKGIEGNGVREPYHWVNGPIGVMEDCSLRYWDGSQWIIPGAPLDLQGTGEEQNPFRFRDSARGLVCEPLTPPRLDGRVYAVISNPATNTWITEAPLIVPGEAAAIPGIIPDSPLLISEKEPEDTCRTTFCKQIDEVWLTFSPYLTLPDNIKGRIWDTFLNVWRAPIVPPEVPIAPPEVPPVPPPVVPPVPLPPEIADIIVDPLIEADLAAGLYDMRFLIKVERISRRLNINPVHLLAIMRFETASTFRPDIQHPRSQATGLIQFVPSTARDLRTTVEELSRMTQLEQLDYVEQYLRRWAARIRSNNFGDLAMAVFYPRGIGLDDNDVLFSRGTAAYNLNQRLDVNNDGSITRGEYLAPARRIGAYDLTRDTLFLERYPVSFSEDWRFDPGIREQEDDATLEIFQLADCMRRNLNAGVGRISSVSDSAGFLQCQQNYARPPCHHAQRSSHYGCGTYYGSLSLDIGDEENTCEIARAAVECGAHAIFGPDRFASDKGNECNIPGLQSAAGHEDHVHVSIASLSRLTCDQQTVYP